MCFPFLCRRPRSLFTWNNRSPLPSHRSFYKCRPTKRDETAILGIGVRTATSTRQAQASPAETLSRRAATFVTIARPRRRIIIAGRERPERPQSIVVHAFVKNARQMSRRAFWRWKADHNRLWFDALKRARPREPRQFKHKASRIMAHMF
jgi:uncharacterized damage-inducible protein DinB